MSPDAWFSLAGMLVLPAWLLLATAPRWKWTAQFVAPVLVPLLLAVLYIYQIALHWGDSPGGFGSLEEVAQLFENRNLLLAGWIHYLAFDLFIGSWEVRDAQRHGVPHLLVIPCLLLTFLFGPAGLLLYFLLRSLRNRGLLLTVN